MVLNKPVGRGLEPAGGRPGPSRAAADRARRCVGESPSIPDRDTRLAPLGRLDQDSHGLLVLSEDGVLAKALIGPQLGAGQRVSGPGGRPDHRGRSSAGCAMAWRWTDAS